MRKITTASIVVSFLFVSILVRAQINEKESHLKTLNTDTITGWKTGGITSLSFSQTALKNWAAGGENSVSLNTLMNLYARYVTPNSEWSNTFDFGYGFMNQSVKGFTKTDDKLEIISKYGRRAYENLYYSALVGFRTQLFEGFDFKPTPALKISDFLSPAYGVVALGINYKPNNYFNAFVSPVTSKTTFVYNDSLANAGAFGVTKGKHLREELGGYIRLGYTKNDFNYELLKNFSIVSKLDLFTNYLDHPEHIDVNWENLIVMKVNKYVSMSLITSLVYDYDIKINGKDKVQFKEILGLGLAYTFKN